ncbi:threonylcarbamoyl-AMP synthase [Paenarthrobacter sp. Z7-10]|uniref:L-threonylcarbamoyladenylate synthase n=1 Tax=Paenarthrobacter sp. Z7-10 TaxID=2787635 RepID=UPI0022A9F239|nr:L-threonylcarbamoyladenylate synthase [Paenarthrobacter sp. Z7-10]MCZ2402418.1 threonylcarbamoyl-AMP synthase [Paenarthrobacter sp. Z7-10]
MSTTSYDCSSDDQRAEGLAHAQRALAHKQVVVMPTDTVYGIAADAFSPQAVATLLAAKGRGRSMPPPVLIPRIQTMDGLAAEVSEDARKLASAFWPGGLTLIFHAQPTLTWDLGDTMGTVALRMPQDQLALDLLTITGPLAVSSANRTGHPAARTAAEALAQLAESVEVYLENGWRPAEDAEALSSTIVDTTGEVPRVVRTGAVSLEQLRAVVPSVLGPDEAVAEADYDGSRAAAAEAEPTVLQEHQVDELSAFAAADGDFSAAFSAGAGTAAGDDAANVPAEPAAARPQPETGERSLPIQPSPDPEPGRTT